jgi:hypothetical protein
MAVNIGELLTTTLQYVAPGWADNLSANNVLYYTLKEKNRIVEVDGGIDLREPLMYPATSQGKWFDGYDDLNISPMDALDSAIYYWKSYSIPTVISGTDKRKNSGSKVQLRNLLKSRVDVTKKTMINDLDTGLYSAGTANGGKQIGGLDYLFATSSGSTVGSISKTTYTFWQHTIRTSAPARSAATIKSELDAVMTPMTRGTDKVSLGLLSDVDYNYMLAATQAIQVISQSKLADVGFEAIKYRGADMALAGGSGTHITSGRIYLLNPDYITLRVHPDLNIAPLEPEERSPVAQDSVIRHMGFMGNLTVSNMALGGAVLL